MTEKKRLLLRQFVIENGLHREVMKARWLSYSKGDRSALDAFEDKYGVDTIKVALSVACCGYNKRRRVKDRTQDIIVAGDCIFLTLTFTDDVLANTSEQTRRRYVSRYLKSQSSVYVANIDFGDKNDREHYHALIKASNVDYSLWHAYGAIKGKVVKSTVVSAERLAKYIVKLSNHAIKETAGKGRRIIYSRMVLL